AVADDDLALHHARCASDGVAELAVDDGVLLPHLGAGGGVECDETAVVGGHVHPALVQRHAAVDHIAAALVAGLARYLRVIRPDALAGAHIDRVHHAP